MEDIQELPTGLLYRNARLRIRRQAAAFPAEVLDSDEEDCDLFNDPDFHPASRDNEHVDRADDEALEDFSQGEEKCVLEMQDAHDMCESTSDGRRIIANKKNSTPLWVEGNESDETQSPHFEKDYVLNGTVREPIQYFRWFFTEETWQMFVDQSNLYSTQKNVNKPLNTDRAEVEQWLGLCIYFSASKLPSYRMHWNTSIGFHRELVANVMSRDRFLEIKTNLHLVDNNDDLHGEKLFKVKPLVTHLRKKFQSIPMDQELCINEQILPFKGASGMKQYIPSKPNKWSDKIFVLADKSGMIHDFIPYTGKIEPMNTKSVSDLNARSNAVLHLAEIIPEPKNHILYFDDRFSSVALLEHLATRGIWCCAAIRASCITGLPENENNEKLLISKGQGSFSERKTSNLAKEVTHVQWYDNKIVNLVSTFAKAKPVEMVQKYSRKKRVLVEVPCPSIVALYNQGMGGVGIADRMISLYRICLRSKKYYQRLIFHLVDMTLLNSWNCYKRDAKFLNISNGSILKFVEFKMKVASDLLHAGKPNTQKRRIFPETTPKLKKYRRFCTMPQPSARFDKIDHFPFVDKLRRMCKNEGCSGKTNVVCCKCMVNLCMHSKSNCFAQFHGACSLQGTE